MNNFAPSASAGYESQFPPNNAPLNLPRSLEIPWRGTPIAAFVGIDWADQKHDIVLCAATGHPQFEHRSIGSDPDALAEWALEMQGRFGSQGKILICLEQSRGALIYFLMGYECFELYPINPKQLSSYRAAFRPSGAKDDPVDGKLLCQLIGLHHQSFAALASRC